jgi:uncharacterized protein with FMN-binding domain
MLKKILIAILVIVIIIIIVGAVFYIIKVRPMTKEVNAIRQMEITNVDLNKVADGVYPGDFTYGGFTYEIEVSVKGHKIENIKILKNRDTKYAKMAEGVMEKIMLAQSLKVDAVTGATTTSKALMKACENALNKGIQK